MPKLCGIDEAGRGPLAGDWVMAGMILHEPIDGLMDSKQLNFDAIITRINVL